MKMQVAIVGRGSPMLMLMGGGLTGSASWEPHAERLAAQRRVIRPQLLTVELGLEGQPMPRGYSVKMESRALAETLDALDFTDPMDLVAWSYGALVTLDYALDHPDRVRSLALIEPPALWVLRSHGPLTEEQRDFANRMRRGRDDISEEQLEAFVRDVGLVPPGQPVRELPQWPTWNRHRQSLRANPAVLEHLDDVRRLNGFRRPTLLVKGTGSSPVLHRIIDLLADDLPEVQLLELPSGHAPHLVSMDAFLQRLGDFQGRAR
ncbi:MAG: alpha/beta fold hydrolase [Myxococcaceae bacterium]